MYEGNTRFRDLVIERKDEYLSAAKHKKKQKIAQELVNAVRASGGRFLCLSEGEQTAEVSNIVDNGTWIEAESKVALEKCKQSLRENRKKSKLPKKRPAVAIEAPVVEEEAKDPEPIISSVIDQNFVAGFASLPPDDAGSSNMLAYSAKTSLDNGDGRDCGSASVTCVL